MSPSIHVDACRAWIGRQETASDIVTPELVKRFCATLDLGPCDARLGDVAPLGLHWCLAPAAAPSSALGRDGHPELGEFLPPIPLPRRMWAGGLLAFFGPIRIGDTVSRISTIEDVVLKDGRTGPLCFVTVRHAVSVADDLRLDERQDIVYRGFDAKPTPNVAKIVAAPLATSTRDVSTDAVLLFRYSALTFNGHRIHYDRRFCVEEEGYPGLVVHGPLQATLLLQFAGALRGGQVPRTFSFRSTAPIFDGTPFQLNAIDTDAGLHLWAAEKGAQAAMSAEAVW